MAQGAGKPFTSKDALIAASIIIGLWCIVLLLCLIGCLRDHVSKFRRHLEQKHRNWYGRNSAGAIFFEVENDAEEMRFVAVR